MFDWDSKRLGEEIKNLRQMAGMSQKELADGTNLTQATISKLEKGNDGKYPYAPTLFQISERLGVPVEYFFHIATHTEVDHAKNVKQKIRYYIKNHDYASAYSFIKKESKHPIFIRNKINHQFLLWHEGVALFYIKDSKDDSLKILNKALELTNCTPKLQSERDIEILNSIGIIYFECGDLDNSINTYLRALEQYELIPYNQDPSIKTKLIYNLAKSHTRKQNYVNSTSLCLEGIKWAVANQSLRLLGKLHYHIGYNYLESNKHTEANAFFVKSIFYFELENDQNSLSKAKEMLELTTNNS